MNIYYIYKSCVEIKMTDNTWCAYDVASKKVDNNIKEEELEKKLDNLQKILEATPGLNYGHIYTRTEVEWIRNKYNELKKNRGANTIETEEETKYRKHLALNIPDNVTETITENLKKRINTPNDIRPAFSMLF